jgi:hypothetical protein
MLTDKVPAAAYAMNTQRGCIGDLVFNIVKGLPVEEELERWHL